MQHPLSPVARGLDFHSMFCNDLDAATASWLHANLGPEPPGPMAEPVAIATAPDGVGSTYVLLQRDQALPPDYQREMARNARVDEVVGFDAGHSAFASRPAELAGLLLGYAWRRDRGEQTRRSTGPR
jgi:Alpha/beta hydrolase family